MSKGKRFLEGNAGWGAVDGENAMTERPLAWILAGSALLPVLSGVGGLFATGSPGLALAEEAEISFEAVPPDKWTGEPYELAGKRLGFPNWCCARPRGDA